KQTTKDMNAAIQAMQNAPAGGGAPLLKPDFAKIQEDNQAAAAKEITGKILRPSQVARLRQIDLQARGPYAFQTERVEAALKLTAAQKAKVKDLIDEMHTKAKKKMEDAMNAKPVNGGPNVVVAF